MTKPRIYLWPHQIIHLNEYSTSLPTGTVPGKFWKRRRMFPYEPAVWSLGMYGDPKGDKVPIFWFDIELYQGPDFINEIHRTVKWDNHCRNCLRCHNCSNIPEGHFSYCVPVQFKIFYNLYLEGLLYPDSIAPIESYLGIQFDRLLSREIICS